MLIWKTDPLLSTNKFSNNFDYSINFYSIFIRKSDFRLKYESRNQIIQRTIYAGGKDLKRIISIIIKVRHINFKEKLEGYLESKRIYPESYNLWIKNGYFPLVFLRVVAHYSGNEVKSLRRIFNRIEYVGSYNKKDLFYLPKNINDILSKQMVYFCGFMYGDGHLAKNERRLTIVDGSKNHIEVERCVDFFIDFKNFLNKLGLNAKITKSKNECVFIINSKSFCRFLFFFFEHPIGEKTLVELPSILNFNEKLLEIFIRGLFDADGSFKSQVQLSNKNRKFLENVGIFLNKKLINYSITHSGRGYALKVLTKNTLKFAQKFGSSHPNKKEDLIHLLKEGSKHTFFKGFKNLNSQGKFDITLLRNFKIKIPTKSTDELKNLVTALRPWGEHKVRIIKRQTKDIRKLTESVKRVFSLEVKNGIIYSVELRKFLDNFCVYSIPWQISEDNLIKLKNEWDSL